MSKKSELMDLVASFESDFSDPKEYQSMSEFMQSFYEVLEDDEEFEKVIVAEARTK